MDQCLSCWTPGHSTHSTFSLGFLGDHCRRVSGRSQGFTSDHSFVPGVLFSLYKVHANKKALVQKEKSKVLLSCKVHKKTCKHLTKTSWVLVENSVWRNRRVSDTPFFWRIFFFGGEGTDLNLWPPQNKYVTRMELIKCHTYATP